MESSFPKTQGLIRLCSAADVEDGEALRVELTGRNPIAVFHVNDDFLQPMTPVRTVMPL